MPETSGDDYFQKHPPEVLYRERCPLKFHKIHRKIPLPESESCNLIKKEILAQKTPFLQSTSGGCFCTSAS